MKNYQGVYLFPVLGKILRLIHRLATIGRIENELNQRILELEQSTSRANSDLATQLDVRLEMSMTSFRGEISHAVTSAIFELEQSTSRANSDLATQLDVRLDMSMTSFRGEISHAVTSQRNEWKATLATNSRVIERTTRTLLENGLTQSTGVSGIARLATPESYIKFEDAFRGRWKVEERVRWYIPHVREIMALGSRKPMLDIGCGRGEWMLELKRNNFTVLGVDLNPAMADAARAQGLEVVLADAAAHLDSLEPASLSVVSAFHLVEHLPFEQVLILVDAAFRALMPGGLLILETPNPENLVVGACTFWYDPTHIRPLPPAMLRFYVESAGFAPVRTARFYLRTDGPDHATMDEPVSPSVDGPLDYGLLAQKPR